MNPFAQYSLFSARADPPRRQRGFTLFALGLALLGLGLGTYIAVAEVGKFRHRVQRDQFIAELRRLATAFETHRTQNGEWPAATNPESRMPRGMEASLAGTSWLKGPPFGGSYDWTPKKNPGPKPDNEGDTPRPVPNGAISVTAFSPSPPLPLTPADLIYIDGKLDDGNLATGRFRTGFNGWPVYLIPASR